MTYKTVIYSIILQQYIVFVMQKHTLLPEHMQYELLMFDEKRVQFEADILGLDVKKKVR